MEEFNFVDHAKVQITYYKWTPAAAIKPKAVVQIVHGLGEHAKRYDHVALTFNQDGYVVYATDHRGHGKTSEQTGIGSLKPDGWSGTVQDEKELTDIIKKEHPDLPVFLLGHSWGSFLSQNYIQQWGSGLKGAILSGTSGKQGLLGALAIIAKRLNKKKGPDAISPMMGKLALDPMNKPFAPNRTTHDWLTRDDAEVDKYVADPLCGFDLPNSYWLEMANGLKHIWKKENEAKIPKDLPILLMTGELDPVNVQTKTYFVLLNRYKKIGIKDVSSNIYEGARHETLNELQKDKVKKDILDWLNAHL
jgi:alpha-beta hydrolase superfamily lysophospholipase